ARHLRRPRRAVRRDPPRVGSVRPVVQRGLLRGVVSVSQQSGDRPRADRQPDLPLPLAPAPRPLRPALPARARLQGDDGPAARLPAAADGAGPARARVHPVRPYAEPRAAGARRAHRHHRRRRRAHRRAARRLGDDPRRRRDPHLQPERLAAARSRRPERARSLRRALPPVLGRDLVPDGLPLPRGQEGGARAQEAREPAPARPALRRAGRRRLRHSLRGAAVLPRRRPLPLQRLRPGPDQHLPRSDRVPRVPGRARSRGRPRADPGQHGGLRRRRVHGRPSRLRGGGPRDFHRQACLSRGLPGARAGRDRRGQGRVAARAGRHRRLAARLVRALARAGGHDLHRGQRAAPARLRRAGHRGRLPAAAGVCMARRGMGVPHRRRPGPDRELHRQPLRGLDQPALPVVSLRGRAPRPVQRVRLQLLQDPHRGAHPVRRGLLRRAVPRPADVGVRRLPGPAPLPPSQGRPDPLRRGGGRHPHLHPPRLAVRARHRALPDLRRPPAAQRADHPRAGGQGGRLARGGGRRGGAPRPRRARGLVAL
ncbi:MAG: UDP-N-acetylmuramic acid hydroxylase, partial [uncultured Solirubrobacterales bacterium]